MTLLVVAPLSAALGWAAWCDWRTRRVPFPLLWGLWGCGVISAVLSRHWTVAIGAGMAGVLSSCPKLSLNGRRVVAIAVLSASAMVSERGTAVALALIGLFWLAFETHLVGGADAGIAIGLLAWAPTLPFALTLVCTWAVFSGWAWFARRRVGQTAPLVVALASAGVLYGWGAFFFAG